MRKFLTVAIIFAAFFLVGCGDKKNENNYEDAYLIKDSFWVVEPKNMVLLSGAIARRDIEYLKQLLLEGKIFSVDRDTKVSRFGETANNDTALIIFREGRYTNKTGCTFTGNLYSVEEYQALVDEKEKERERQLKQQTEHLEKEKQALIDEKKANEREALIAVENSLLDTEEYAQYISDGNVDEVNRLAQMCSNYDLILVKYRNSPRQGKKVFYCVDSAMKILKERRNALSFYLTAIRNGNSETYTKPMITHIQKAESMRQNFLDEYGF